MHPARSAFAVRCALLAPAPAGSEGTCAHQVARYAVRVIAAFDTEPVAIPLSGTAASIALPRGQPRTEGGEFAAGGRGVRSIFS